MATAAIEEEENVDDANDDVDEGWMSGRTAQMAIRRLDDSIIDESAAY